MHYIKDLIVWLILIKKKKLKGLFGNVVQAMLFVFFWKYVWVKNYIKIRVMLFKC